ncbi:MAG: transcription elongation factor GreA [Gammaproteobacteria bacterium]|nr:transcription elongation factor GreA [Gammaproteobacteria bacterium]MDH5652223.1 transcription elongation factor GreA [Gammaproteobacteria bacterium]
MSARPPITAAGAERLREELKDLKSVQRPKVIQAIAEAREHGDLKENAEYHAAREQQSFMEGRIQELEAVLSNAEIIDVKTVGANAGSRIVFGATVKLYDINDEKEVTYQIVGDLEADIKKGLIAVSSPIARSLIGKSEEDEVVVKAPGGDREYEIIKVTYQ